MSRKFPSLAMATVIACMIGAISTASTSKADVIAYWQFDGANFLDDSSGNGHTLSLSGDVTQVGDAASFNGGVLSANIDLSPYRKVVFSWDQVPNSTSGDQIIFEHTSNYNSTAGAMMGHLEVASLFCGDGKYNYDFYSASSGSFSVEFNLDAVDVADVVKISKNGVEIGTAGDQNPAPAAFLNALFNLGARQGGIAPYYGTIDNFKIEGYAVPEPGAVCLLLTGVLGLAAYAWRKRK